MESTDLEEFKTELIANIESRAKDKIIEQSNADLLKKLINQAESQTEALNIAALGTTYKRTGFHFDKRLEKVSNDIKFKVKNEKLSFVNDKSRPTHELIIGDNYDALQNLLINYKGSIDVIYIDPPYGKDSMGEFAQTNYNNAITRDNLLSMLYPRLTLAKRLLSEEGVIFCSIDDKNQAYVKGLFDEIFGEENFCGTFIWQKKTGGGQTDDFFVTEHEYILVYQKSSMFEWLDFYEDKKEEDFKYDDNNGKGKYAITKLEKWGSEAHSTDRPSMCREIKDPDGNIFLPIAPDGLPGRWRVGDNRLLNLINKGEVYWKKDTDNGRYIPYEKVYYSNAKGKLNKSRSILYQFAGTGTATKLLTSIFNQKDIFDNAKPIEIIEYLLEHVKGEIVLDFFAGSGTTGQAVMELNKKDEEKRTFILCQSIEKTTKTPNGIAYDVTSKRLKRIMSGECYDGTKDFAWLSDHQPYMDNLEVYEIAKVSKTESESGKTAFDKIDETCYGKEKFQKATDKIKWVCQNFENATKFIDE